MSAKIIRFPTERRLTQSKETAPSDEKPKQKEYLNYAKLTELLVFLGKLYAVNPYQAGNVEIRQGVLEGSMTNEELIKLLNQSDELSWKANPSYWSAVYEELNKRELMRRNDK